MGYAWSQRDESIGAGVLRIATEQVAKAILSADALSDPPAGRIHSARRRCKRLRGLFRLVRSDFPAYRGANAQVRDAAAALSTARDAAVLYDTVGKLYRWAGQPVPEGPGTVDANPEAEEAALARFRKAMVALLAEAEGWKLGKIDHRTLGKGFERCYARATRAADQCRRKPDDEAFHDWRKQVKYHSFHLILLKNPLADGTRVDLERIEHLAELLGRHHDLAVLRQAARTDAARLGKDLDPAFVEANAGLLQDHLAARAFALAAEAFARPPRVVRDSVETRWQAWWHPLPAAEPV